MLLQTLLCSCTLAYAYSTGSALSTPSNASLLWGPYWPNLYLGIRPRTPNSLLMGLIWSNTDKSSHVLENLRHTCEQDEGMAGYGWTAYDARKGGIQVVNDTGNKLDLITLFAKPSDEGSTWGLRFKGIPRADASDHQKTTMIFYVGSENTTSSVGCRKERGTMPPKTNVLCQGVIDGMGNYKVRISDYGADSDDLQRTHVKSLTVPADSLWQAKSLFTSQLTDGSSHEGMLVDSPGEGNLHFVQKMFTGGFEFEVLFSLESSSEEMASASLTEGIQVALSAFSERFKSIYAPQAPFRGDRYIKFSQSLLSNLMGGIGYFYGTSRVDISSAPEYAEVDQDFWEKAASARSRAIIEDKGPYQLFSAVPSRPFFPRGFLWDEGFHLQLILDWDVELALEIVSSWFDLMDENGWIAREQILGPEAKSKVPQEFQTQYPHYVNPPTLFLVVQEFLTRLNNASSYLGARSQYLSDPEAGKAYLTEIYPKMKKHYKWFCRIQAGNLTSYQAPGFDFNQGYRWRGRTSRHILTSGLDDYPRAQPPHPEELHLDALCWVGSMAMALRKISAFLGEKEDEKVFLEHERNILRSIDGIHWSEPDQAYCDTTVVDGNRVEKVCHKGYISLFPFLVGLMGPDHSHLETLLDLLRNPEELWSPHGIRSLSLKDRYYGTDENYWRSPVWININYMVTQRLLEVAQQPGPCQRKAHEIYIELRLILGNTVFKSWVETGFAWEQYNPDTGNGQRTQHFTGWTSLIVKILAMPDLRLASQPQISFKYQLTGLDKWTMTPTLMALGTVLIGFMFRRRLMRTWGGLCKRD